MAPRPNSDKLQFGSKNCRLFFVYKGDPFPFPASNVVKAEMQFSRQFAAGCSEKVVFERFQQLFNETFCSFLRYIE